MSSMALLRKTTAGGHFADLVLALGARISMSVSLRKRCI